MESSLAPPSTKVPFRNVSLKKSESGLTTYNIIVPRKHSRDSSVIELVSLLLIPQKTKLSSQPSVLDQELLFYLQNQQYKIDNFIAQHMEKVRMELQQQRVRQSEIFVQFFNGYAHLPSINTNTGFGPQIFREVERSTGKFAWDILLVRAAIDTEEMGDRMERLVILPFSFGCVSEASVVVGIPHPRRSRLNTNSPTAATRHKGDKGVSESLSGESMRNLLRFHEDVTKSNISLTFNRLLKGFKNIPRLFGELDKEEKLEEVEMDMQVGSPTNVQHVTHIGWDGFAGTETATSSNSLHQSLSSLPSEHCQHS
ncbi:hypothetical protein VNO78_34819 [Psophocarpus tetragonolobus]|uniref:CRIB domain-containing protein n=1 Tax=Psophocarpus tetragonolobus TaxID=3891 RepID=A0AAN9RRC9_PSOTE